MKVNKYLNSTVFFQEETENKKEQDLKTIDITSEDLEAIIAQVEADSSPVSIPDILEKETVQSRTLYLNGVIEPESVDWMIQMIHKWNREDTENELSKDERQPITLYINSEGGEAYAGSALLATIENSVTPVIGIVEGGMCMSMALLLWMGCHIRIVSRYSFVMYHTLRSGSDTKTLKEFNIMTQHYTYMQDMMDNLILEKTTVPKEFLKSKRESNLDWFITYDELKKYGFANAYQ